MEMVGVVAMIVYLGCYADEVHPNGLKALELDEATGAMSVVAEYSVSNALYQELSADGKYLYSCSGEGLISFQLVGRAVPSAPNGGVGTRRPTILAQVDSVKLGNCVCHVAEMQDGKRVVFADYLGGFAGLVEVKDGKFGNPVIHRHSGSGSNLPRQDKAHCHQAIPTPDGKSYCVVDLGLDELVEYPSGRVFRTLPPGAGPRHLLFHPNGRLAFLVYELGNLVSSLSWSPADGFKLLDTRPTLTDSNNSIIPYFHNSTIPHSSYLAAAISFTPDGKRIVISNRGENSLVLFDFDEMTGKLAFKARTMLPGNWPRDFIFVNDTLALVACERSGEVLAMRYDSSTGVFTQIAALDGLYRPVALSVIR